MAYLASRCIDSEALRPQVTVDLHEDLLFVSFFEGTKFKEHRWIDISFSWTPGRRLSGRPFCIIGLGPQAAIEGETLTASSPFRHLRQLLILIPRLLGLRGVLLGFAGFAEIFAEIFLEMVPWLRAGAGGACCAG